MVDMELDRCGEHVALQQTAKGDSKDEETSSETSVSSVDESFQLDDDSARSPNAHQQTGDEQDLPPCSSVNGQHVHVRFNEGANVCIEPPDSESIDEPVEDDACWYKQEDYATFKTFQNYLVRTVSATAESEEVNMANTFISTLSRTYEKCCSDKDENIDPSNLAPSREQEQVLLNVYQDAEALFGIERTLIRTISNHVAAQKRELLNKIWDLEEQGAKSTLSLDEQVRASCEAITISSRLFARYKAHLTSQMC